MRFAVEWPECDGGLVWMGREEGMFLQTAAGVRQGEGRMVMCWAVGNSPDSFQDPYRNDDLCTGSSTAWTSHHSPGPSRSWAPASSQALQEI